MAISNWLQKLITLITELIKKEIEKAKQPKVDPELENIIPLDKFIFVNGNKEGHKGPELCIPMGKFTLRATVNDSDNRLRQSKGEYYFPRRDIFDKFISAKTNSVGDLVLTGNKESFIVDGYKYVFCGWTLRTDAPSSPFIAKYVVTVPKAEISGAMRGYIATVQN